MQEALDQALKSCRVTYGEWEMRSDLGHTVLLQRDLLWGQICSEASLRSLSWERLGDCTCGEVYCRLRTFPGVYGHSCSGESGRVQGSQEVHVKGFIPLLLDSEITTGAVSILPRGNKVRIGVPFTMLPSENTHPVPPVTS